MSVSCGTAQNIFNVTVKFEKSMENIDYTANIICAKQIEKAFQLIFNIT